MYPRHTELPMSSVPITAPFNNSLQGFNIKSVFIFHIYQDNYKDTAGKKYDIVFSLHGN